MRLQRADFSPRSVAINFARQLFSVVKRRNLIIDHRTGSANLPVRRKLCQDHTQVQFLHRNTRRLDVDTANTLQINTTCQNTVCRDLHTAQIALSSNQFTEQLVKMSEAPQTKKFQKGERTITPASQKASKYYPAEDDAQPKKVRITRCWIGRYGRRHWNV